MEGTDLQEKDSIANTQVISKGTGGTSTITVITDQTISANEQRTVNNHNQSVLQPTSSVVTSISPIQANIIGSGTIVSTNNSQANNDSQSSNINNHQIQTHHSHTNPLIQDAHKSVPTVAEQQSMVTAGSMSIVQFQLPSNQAATMVQSVIQPNHQSVIQPTNPISAIQLPKNVILVNKLAPGSVIQSTESESNMTLIKEEENETVTNIYEDESKKRREILARRPSYRKILNDLSATDASGAASNIDNKTADDETEQSPTAANTGQPQPQPQSQPQPTSAAIPIPGYIKMLPSIQLSPQDATSIQGIPTIMTNTNTGSNTIVQYATSAQDSGQFIVPDLQTYQLRPPNPTSIAQNVVMTSSQNIPTHTDEALKKREMRLLKNREAAKECRRKKKEYIKCLENRVSVLENQNKALIDELKTLKELYCKKSD